MGLRRAEREPQQTTRLGRETPHLGRSTISANLAEDLRSWVDFLSRRDA
jgi:hypothetical protein